MLISTHINTLKAELAAIRNRQVHDQPPHQGDDQVHVEPHDDGQLHQVIPDKNLVSFPPISSASSNPGSNSQSQAASVASVILPNILGQSEAAKTFPPNKQDQSEAASTNQANQQITGQLAPVPSATQENTTDDTTKDKDTTNDIVKENPEDNETELG